MIEKFSYNCRVRLSDDELDILNQVLSNTDRCFPSFNYLFVIGPIQIILELIEIQLVAIFISAIALGVLLYRIISQMDKLIFTIVFKLILECRGPQVAFLEEEDFHVLINEHPNPDIKFTPFYQKWFFNILLDDKLHSLRNIQTVTEHHHRLLQDRW